MKKLNRILELLTVMLMFITCKKENNDIIVPIVPALTTDSVSNITKSTAICGGDVTSDGGAEVTAKGLCWSSLGLPTTDDYMNMEGTGTGSFTSNLTDLTAGTLYYIRAYATNSAGTAYGSQRIFATLPDVTYGSVSDIDGNIYKTVQIGNQIWMAENLRTTKYSNGDLIGITLDITDSVAQQIQWAYGGNENNVASYGRLYRWSVMTNNRNVCPAGWHVPSDAEWTTLTDYLGGEYIAGGKLKESGTTHWRNPNTGGTNETGFSALPGGSHNNNDGTFNGIGYYGSWWSAAEKESSSSITWFRTMSYYECYVSRTYFRYNQIGISIRCLKD